ncbi:MAG: nucleotidyltransferase family protein [Albidovulum sp.]|nr:nucleotidyltransferase family protein [Albidovulum sp.]
MTPKTESDPISAAAIILAGGRSTRMLGRDKLLEKVDGVALIRRSSDAAARSKAQKVFVVLGKQHAARKAQLRNVNVEIVATSLAAEGMAGSIRAGIARLPDSFDGALLLLPDMPGIGTEEIDAILAHARLDNIVRAASCDGTPGNPVYFAKRFFSELLMLEGDSGARSVLDAYSECVSLVRLPGDAALLDLDTRDDWNAWRNRQR